MKKVPAMQPIPCISTSKGGPTPFGDVVEIGLLLPANRADALLELSKQRQQSIGQILRAMIDRELSGQPAVGR
jgi:hypothetical protein